MVIGRIAAMAAGVTDDCHAVDIVHEPVAVVVSTIARDLAGVDPHIGRKVRVGVVHPSVDHSDHNIATTPGGKSKRLQMGPSFGCLYCIKVPLLGICGISLA